jgi:NTE family protein
MLPLPSRLPTLAARPGRRVALCLSGGIALGAFESGAAALLYAEGPVPDWIVGASVGSIGAAILAGNPPERREAQMRRFWEMAADPFVVPWAGGAWRRALNEASALRTLMLGRPGIFAPRLVPGFDGRHALFDLAPLRARLPELVDFERLNSPEAPRLSIVTTDVESGERVVFDTAEGARIGPEEVVASCALLPLFAPVEIGGRLLGDGGLAANVPVDLPLDEPGAEEVVLFAIDLFGRRGSRPDSLSGAAARAGDLVFGNQTYALLEARRREHRLRGLVTRLAREAPEGSEAAAEARAVPPPPRTAVMLLGYRAAKEEAGVAKPFDFSAATLTERWESGAATMRRALQRLGPGAEPGFALHEVEG